LGLGLLCDRLGLGYSSVGVRFGLWVSQGSGFPRGIEKVLNFKVGFQDLEKVSYLAKMYIWY